jgi:hypothetical protein
MGERNNIAAQHPQVVKRLSAMLEKVEKDGRTR